MLGARGQLWLLLKSGFEGDEPLLDELQLCVNLFVLLTRLAALLNAKILQKL